MMKILFFGDSITEAVRNPDENATIDRLGCGYVMQVAGRLYERSPVEYEIVNRGIAGHRVPDLYARIYEDCWKEKPDWISILVGVNDVWHETLRPYGTDPARFERVFRMLIEDTKARLPQAKFILCEPFILHGTVTDRKYEAFIGVREYARIVRSLAEEYGLYFLPLQNAISEAAAKYGDEMILSDGVHPTLQGAVVIAREWMKLFEKIEKE